MENEQDASLSQSEYPIYLKVVNRGTFEIKQASNSSDWVKWYLHFRSNFNEFLVRFSLQIIRLYTFTFIKKKGDLERNSSTVGLSENRT